MDGFTAATAAVVKKLFAGDIINSKFVNQKLFTSGPVSFFSNHFHYSNYIAWIFLILFRIPIFF